MSDIGFEHAVQLSKNIPVVTEVRSLKMAYAEQTEPKLFEISHVLYKNQSLFIIQDAENKLRIQENDLTKEGVELQFNRIEEAKTKLRKMNPTEQEKLKQEFFQRNGKIEDFIDILFLQEFLEEKFHGIKPKSANDKNAVDPDSTNEALFVKS